MEDCAQEVQLQTREDDAASRDKASDDNTITSQLKISIDYKWWCRISLYTIFLISGQTAGILLGRLYFYNGGNSKWMSTFVISGGFPFLIPLLFFVRRFAKSSMDMAMISSSTNSSPGTPSVYSCSLLYLFLGLVLAGDNKMYSYGLSYLPVSTYSLLCATQLAFNAIFSFFLNSQKFTALILNSLVLLTVSASLLAVHSDSDNSTKVSKAKYAIGFLSTLGASAIAGLYLSLSELYLKKLFKKETINVLLGLLIFPGLIATSLCVVGLFASGEWRTLQAEMEQYHGGRVSYAMTLLWTAITWQICAVGVLGLILEVSSLFANVISTFALPAVPVLAVLTFQDKMDGVKVIALLLAIWGFLSYVYQHYLDDIKSKSITSNGDEMSSSV